MSIDDDIALLERIPLLRQLGDRELRLLAIGGENHRFSAGQVLFTAGETADGAYVVQRGSFTLQAARHENGEIIAGRGALIGESALICETTRPATATAREGSSAMRISRVMFLKMLEGYPEAALRLREVMASRAEQWAREVENVRNALNRGAKPR